MYCPNCNEPTEQGATYCGNCGHILKKSQALGTIGLRGYNSTYNSSYNLVAVMHANEMHALMSLLCGIMGLAGTLFIPVVGLSLGVAGLVLGTVSRVYAKRTMHIAGLVLSALAILAGLATWTYAVRNDPRVNPDVSRVAPASREVQVAAGISTPCYTLNFVDELNISNDSSSCNMNAFNGKTIGASTNAYKVYASKADIGSVNDFANLAKGAVEKDIAKSVPDFKVTSEKVSTFAGSPSYTITASDPEGQVSLVESVVMHQVSNGNNIFVLVHANNSDTADLQILESQWQWK
jgi:hypothetical protein